MLLIDGKTYYTISEFAKIVNKWPAYIYQRVHYAPTGATSRISSRDVGGKTFIPEDEIARFEEWERKRNA